MQSLPRGRNTATVSHPSSRERIRRSMDRALALLGSGQLTRHSPGSAAFLDAEDAYQLDSRPMSAQPAEGSTGTATILFTDLVASTTWRVQLGEERAEARRQAHHRLLTHAITTHHRPLHHDLGDR